MFGPVSYADHPKSMARSQPRPQSETTTPAPHDHARVLVVEDDDSARALLRRVLSRHGLEVIESADAASALRQLFDSRPAIVILDLHVPDLHGRSLLTRIR